MVKGLFDTCILIDYLNGIESAREELNRYEDKAISVITWMELMVGISDDTRKNVEDWLSQTFTIIDIEQSISHKAVEIRKQERIKLPDAIIYATAQISGRLLITRNIKDFSNSNPAIRIPYQI
jgi:predicted nucleic acid-binding protein